MKPPRPGHSAELIVLGLIGGGLIAILLTLIWGLFHARGGGSLPNWAENVLVAIATGTTLKLGDVLSTLVALASGRQVEALGRTLAAAQPVTPDPVPKDAAQGAQQTADAARDVAEQLGARASGSASGASPG